MFLRLLVRASKPSHPTWVRGLKYVDGQADRRQEHVAPHVGAWIEITDDLISVKSVNVAPHVGAWIEIP